MGRGYAIMAIQVSAGVAGQGLFGKSCSLEKGCIDETLVGFVSVGIEYGGSVGRRR